MAPAPQSSPSPDQGGGFRAALSDALRFWEPRRILYNLVLVALAGVWVVRTWPHFRPAVVAPHLPEILALTGLANLCYSAAYLVEFSLLDSSGREAWRRWRWVLWVAGTLFALILAQYWIGDEIYPSVL